MQKLIAYCQDDVYLQKTLIVISFLASQKWYMFKEKLSGSVTEKIGLFNLF